MIIFSVSSALTQGCFFHSSLRSRLLSLSWVLDEVWKVCCMQNIFLDPSKCYDVPAPWETCSNWIWEKWNIISGHVQQPYWMEWPAQLFTLITMQSGSFLAKNWLISPNLAWFNYYPNRSTHKFLTQRLCFFKSVLNLSPLKRVLLGKEPLVILLKNLWDEKQGINETGRKRGTWGKLWH